ncbi:hypothetical protein KC887_07155 [Candidatus Kaiserbacteria bacterium]|nr:hypothetical protein [Candidatus Kaiserbacteria bacterium]
MPVSAVALTTNTDTYERLYREIGQQVFGTAESQTISECLEKTAQLLTELFGRYPVACTEEIVAGERNHPERIWEKKLLPVDAIKFWSFYYTLRKQLKLSGYGAESLQLRQEYAYALKLVMYQAKDTTCFLEQKYCCA